MISSAKHSATFLTFLNAASLAPMEIIYKAKLILLKGETSTAVFLTTPPDPALAESSLGPALETASKTRATGFLLVIK